MSHTPTDSESVFTRLQQEWRFLVATFAASGVGYLGSAGAPIIVQALIDAGLNTKQAGDLGTVELMTLAVTSTLVLPFVTAVSHRKLAIGGAAIAAVGLLISVLSESYTTMIVGRLLTGGGSGLAISGANAAIAAREDAERIFAIIWTLGGGITAGLSTGLPRVLEGGNYPMGFGVLLVLCLVGLPLMWWVPPKPVEFAQESGGAGEAEDGASARAKTIYSPIALMALLGMFIYSLAEQALWNFGYYIPVQAGVPEHVVGNILGVTVLMGLVGGAAAAWLGTRFGRVWPIVIGSLLSVIGRWIFISSSTSEWVFVGGLFWGLGFYFVSPYQIGLVAALDRHGRLAVAAGGAMNFGYAVGPTIGGRVLHSLDSTAFLAVIVVATLLSLALLLPLALKLERASKGKQEAIGEPLLE